MLTEKLNILVAEVPGVIPVVQEAWSEHFSMTFCCSMREADRLLARHFDVIVCGTHFAESKMFDLLRHAKASPVSCDTPILCVRVLDGELDSSAFQGISLAAAALGAAAFVDLNRWRREYGFDAAREKLRDLVLSLAEPHGKASIVSEPS
ncbi:hypothetical protein [Noviherbaspirillum malthae]|uniref:hypothetical protein n=1 Tax=Noviherbaspirillum malthae TaxID=1260987 RepID=UPI00188DF990|nr:hypothetical protein [Noviherbaspirillum malthae]